MKSVIASGLLLGAFHGAAIAGSYVNVESNSGYVGSDWQGSSLETHVGFTNDLSDAASWYVQGGPAFLSDSGVDTETEISGKAGVGVDLTEKLNFYGEVSFLTEDRTFEEDLSFGLKLGGTYSF